MAVLKKSKFKYQLKASTLMETLVATVLIVVVFMVASMILNQLFSNSISQNTRAIDGHLNELHYLQTHNKLELPYSDTFKGWEITVENIKKDQINAVEFEVTNIKTKKTIRKTTLNTH